MNVWQAWETFQNMVNGFFGALPSIGLAIVIFSLFYVLANWVKQAVGQIARRAELAPGAEMLLARFARWLVISLGVLLALNVAVPSFTTGELIQLLGIGSVAVGFAFRDILQNFLAGVLLLLTEPFKINDQIIVGEFEGAVEDIETRATVIKTYDGRRVVIPNADLFTQSVMVNTAFDKRRSSYGVGIGYDEDIGEVARLMLEVVQKVDGVCEEPAPDVLVSELGGSSVVLTARWWTNSARSDVVSVKSHVTSALKEELMAHDVELPFPTQQIILQGETAT